MNPPPETPSEGTLNPTPTPPSVIELAMQQVRTPVGMTLMVTAAIGVLMGAHWPPLVLVMLPFYLVTLLAPSIARRGSTWFVIAAIWAVAVVLRRQNMEDHVYLYLAWLVAVGVALSDPATFVKEAGRQGRYLIAIVFGAATLWKLTSGSFINGAALWTIGLLDDRMDPLLRVMGISAESLDAARPQVVQVARGEQAGFDIELSTYSTVALVAIAVGTIALEATVAATHLVPDTSRLARLRGPVLVLFGVVTYAIVPVLPFALLLALIGSTIAGFERRTVLAFVAMVVVTIVRFMIL